jgi:hypothetical protein
MTNGLAVVVLMAAAIILASPQSKPNSITYPGVTVDTTAIATAVDRDTIIAALRRQIEIVDAVALRRDQKIFLKSVPIVVATSIGSGSENPAVYIEATKSVMLNAQVYERNRPILLHELLHAYHHQKIPDGFRNQEIEALFQQAKTSQQFPATASMLTTVQEYFAMMASVYLHGSAARPPFTRLEVMTRQPASYRWLEKEFGARQVSQELTNH